MSKVPPVDPTSPQATAARIEARLKELGWSARELGRRAGLPEGSATSNAISRLANGQGVHAKTLRRFALALDVSLDWLTGTSDAPPGPHTLLTHTEPAAPRPQLETASGTLAAAPGYEQRRATARRLAPEIVEGWVWDAVDAIDPRCLGVPADLSPLALAALARWYREHGSPRG